MLARIRERLFDQLADGMQQKLMAFLDARRYLSAD